MHFYFFSPVTLSSHSYLYSVIAAVACKTITTMGSRVSSSIESNLEAVAPEEDIALVLRWCLSIGLETILDIAGMQECELLALCPDHLKTRIPPFHRMACRLKRDNLEARATSKLSSLLPERYAFIPPELLHKSHLKGNPKVPGKDDDNVEKEKSLKVARSLLTMMAAKAASSPLAIEWLLPDRYSSSRQSSSTSLT